MDTPAKIEAKKQREQSKVLRLQLTVALSELGYDVEVMGKAVVHVEGDNLLSKLGEIDGDTDANKALGWLLKGVMLARENGKA